MKRLTGCLFVFALSLFAQGIISPIVNLPFQGSWEEHSEWVGSPAEGHSSAADREDIFYQPQSGELVRVGEGPVWSSDRADTILQSLKAVGTDESGAPQPELQRLLTYTYFPHPDGYMEENLARIMAGEQPRPVWDMKNIRGNVPAFYGAQLNPGQGNKVSNGSATVYEKWAPTKLIRAERRQVARGSVILSELETQKPMDRKITERFGLPSRLAGQRTRFCYVVYAATGFVEPGKQITVLWAGPANSDSNADTILHLLVDSGKQARRDGGEQLTNRQGINISPEKPAEELKTLSYSNAEYRWSVSYPGNWTIDSSDPGLVRVSSPSRPGEDALCGFHSGLNTRFKTAREFADFMQAQDEQFFKQKGVKNRSSPKQEITLPNGVADIEVTTDILSGGRSRRIYILAEGVAYSIDCETYASSWCSAPDLLDTELSVFMQRLQVQGTAGELGLA